MPRNPLIDVLKGFAIILVVIGHASQWFTADDRTNPLYVTIYAFHMPLFMFLSGYVNFNTQGKISLKKRFQVLVIPFFVWFFISAAYHGYILDTKKVVHYLAELIYKPTQGMWFLWLLFWQCVVLYIALKVKKHNELWAMIGLWSMLVFLHRLTGAKATFYGLPELCWYFIYFSLGYAFHKYEKRAHLVVRPLGWVSLIAFPVLLFISVEKGNFILYSLRLYALAITGIAASYAVWQWFCQYHTQAKQVLQYLGGISLEIYVTHYYCRFLVPYIQKYIGDNLYVNALVFTLLAIVICDVVQRLVQRLGWVRSIIYGRF